MCQKRNVLEYIGRIRQAATEDEIICTENQDVVVELVSECPQQQPDMPDCAIIVCYLMRQYVHHMVIRRTIEGTTCVSAHATMVEAFVNGPSKGLEDVERG
ncbi:hypothetical protein CsSME_00016769 [Camellia sinensis var. sinensis]